MNLTSIREGELKETFDALEEAFIKTGIDYYLIGAQARDYWFARGKKNNRQTHDVDFAVLVGSANDYETVRNYLSQHKNFQVTKENSFVMLTPQGRQVDILPFGKIEIDSAVTLRGEGLTSIKVNGFLEVYESGTEEITTSEGHSFKVATLSSIVLLKLISYDDRPEMRLKDAGDIAGIIQHFFDLQSDLIYDHHSDLFTDINDEITDLSEISLIVVGREIKRIIRDNVELLNRIKNILEKHIAQREESPFVRAMILNEKDTIEQKVRLLMNMHSSLI